MREFDRRTFLKLCLNGSAGITAGAVFYNVGGEIDEATKEITGHPIGNASFREKVKETCPEGMDEQTCVNNYDAPFEMKLYGTTVGPVLEEVNFRALPSFLLDKSQKENALENIVHGTGGLGLSRRELLVGVASSVVFGLTHNIKSTSLDTKMIPASQTVAGGMYWYLQRKLGFISNTLAHVAINVRAFYKI